MPICICATTPPGGRAICGTTNWAVRPGCEIDRDTVTHEVFAVRPVADRPDASGGSISAKKKPVRRNRTGAPMRIAGKGIIDRARTVGFRFDGRDHTGFEGDTLASALLASGVRLFGAVVQISPPARGDDGGVRRAERAGDCGGGRGSSAQRARHGAGDFCGSRGAQPEPLAFAWIRRDGGQRSFRPVPWCGFLLQDLHVAAWPCGKSFTNRRSGARQGWQRCRAATTTRSMKRPLPSATCW